MLITPAQTFAYVWSCSARLLPISFLILVCACSVEAASEIPDPASASKPEPSDQSRIQSVSRTEISQLEQLIVSQNEAIENLKAKIDR